MPSMYFELQKTRVDWNFYTEPSKTGALGMKNGNYWPRGKLLGGSSSHNLQVYVRGNRRDYDYWADLGNPTWDWDSVLEYFKKSEDNRVEHIAADKKHHGVGGPLKVGSYKGVNLMKSILAEIFIEGGYEPVEDVNGDKHLGFVTIQGTVHEGERFSAAKAFLIPAKDRKNLHVIKNAHVTELSFKKDGTVDGVKFMISDQVKSAVMRKEVILSAGAINTPQVLMLSGIGPKDQLNKHNIKIRQVLPVGHNLEDHLIIPFGMTFHKSTAVPLSTRDLVDAVYLYTLYRTGDLSHIGSTDFMGWVSTVNDPKYPDIQYHLFHFKKLQPELRSMLERFGYKDEITDSFVKANSEGEIVVWVVTLLNPKSSGNIELRSTDPKDTVKIYHNYLMEQDDVDTCIRGIKILRNLTKTNTFKAHEGSVVRVNIPDCAKLEYDSDKYWECYSRHMSTSLYHPTGTAKMGPASDLGSVVDPTLKVKGIKGLRVADASIMPKIVSGNTNAPCIMIGEKAADFIKDEWMSKERVEL